MQGTIYLVQPEELLGTKRFKIGCSAKNDLERFKNGYKKGTRFIHIMECTDPFTLESEIKKVFNEKFKLIAGKEYFEGDEIEMKNEFYKIVNDKNTTIQKNDNLKKTSEEIKKIILSHLMKMPKSYICKLYKAYEIRIKAGVECWNFLEDVISPFGRISDQVESMIENNLPITDVLGVIKLQEYDKCDDNDDDGIY